MLNVKEKLEILCELNDITLATLSQEIGVAKSTVVRWAVYNPSKEFREKLAERFNVAPELFINRKDTDSNEALKSEEQKLKENTIDLIELLNFSVLSYDIVKNLLISVKKNVDRKIAQRNLMPVE